MAEKLDLDALEHQAKFGLSFGPHIVQELIAYARELEDDRDSWAEQASQRVADWQREHDLRVAAERRVGELERASQTGGVEAVAWFIDVPDEPELGHWLAEEPCGEGYRSRALVFADAARAAMGGKEGA